MDKQPIKIIAVFLCFYLISACQIKNKTTHQSKPNQIWQLETTQSQLSFISTKNNNIAESHTIKFLNGQINSELKMKLNLDLNQLETQIPIRNQRMKDLLFETARFPTAQILAQIPKTVPFGTPVTIDFELNLHGVVNQLQARVLVQINAKDHSMSVISYNPIQINAKAFNLDEGINQLTQVAKLKAISYEVPVDFKLVFNKIEPTNQ
ncbi:YceI family protein [Marinicella rhabdoformis]|uniref:YceI family protein n=1 Tax=Marinicella rhabdoformis TaxID=2580566 RepID=UPI0012AECF27|nr:YceI family protein [Marinicella rhabdoformis]